MTRIDNFPVSLQPIIQQGFLEREFAQAMKARLGYRACADRFLIDAGIGETITNTRAGTRPTEAGYSSESYEVTLNHYAATVDLNVITERGR